MRWQHKDVTRDEAHPWLEAVCPPVATLSVGLGALLAASPPARRTAPAFAAPRHVMPLTAWGLILLIIAVVLLLEARLRYQALMAAASWYAFWAGSLAYSTKIQPHATLTGPWVYGWISVAHLWLALRLRPHPRR